MKQKKTIILLLFAGALTILSCEKKGGENETNISYYNIKRSHNDGQNCMNCHKEGGPGAGWFNIAGTVYDDSQVNKFPNATVKLFTGADGSGELKYTIQVDGLGNFYTTEMINFGNGLYPSVQGTDLTKYMSFSITAGQCNGCHGTSAGRIWTK